MITLDRMRRIFPRCADPRGWAAAFDSAITVAGIKRLSEVQHMLAQVGHESAGLTAFKENMRYTKPETLVGAFPSKFRNAAAAEAYTDNPQALANFVYGTGKKAEVLGNRIGTQDGWNYRGRGPFQLTGRANFVALQTWIDQRLGSDGPSVVENPELLEKTINGALSVAWFWVANGCGSAVNDSLNDKAVVRAVTRKINPPMHGLKDREVWLDCVKRLWDQ